MRPLKPEELAAAHPGLDCKQHEVGQPGIAGTPTLREQPLLLVTVEAATTGAPRAAPHERAGAFGGIWIRFADGRIWAGS